MTPLRKDGLFHVSPQQSPPRPKQPGGGWFMLVLGALLLFAGAYLWYHRNEYRPSTWEGPSHGSYRRGRYDRILYPWLMMVAGAALTGGGIRKFVIARRSR